jgi:predicted hydrocarbon binding protein
MLLRPEHDFCYRNIFARIIMQTLKSALGNRVMADLLRQADMSAYIGTLPPDNFEKEFSVRQVTALFTALGKAQGTVRQLCLAGECGQAIARYMFTEQWGHNLDTLPFRTRSQAERLEAGIRIMHNLLGDFAEHHVDVVQRDGQILFTLERCEVCAGQEINETICRLMLGFLVEGLSIFSLGECTFRGDLTTVPARGGVLDGLIVYQSPAQARGIASV